MDENLIELVKQNHFSNINKTRENQISSIINQKCSKNILFSLANLLKEIDETLSSNYVKELEQRFVSLEQRTRIILDSINDSIISIENLEKDGDEAIEGGESFIESIRVRYEEINKLEKHYKTLETQEEILEIISNIQSALVLEDVELASEQMAELIDHLHLCDCQSSIVTTLYPQLHKYHSTIENQLIKLFNECITEIHWPFITSGLVSVPSSSQLDTDKFEMIAEKFSQHFRNLYLIELPDDLKEVVPTKTNLINTTFMSNVPLSAICLPIRLLLQPFVKYFRFFFWTDSKVNKISKPEWYMSQVVQWISIHQAALEHMFATSLLDCIDVKLEFIRALVIMVMEKVHRDLELTKNNDDLFFHLIEESLTMTLDLRREFDYPESYPDLIDVVCNDEESFRHWMTLEERFALKQLDEIFLSTNSWRPISTKCKRVECIECFTGLIVSMKERIECISDVSRQSRFCEVLLEVLENYRLRLLQITKNYDANTKRWFDVMNVVLGVKMFLRGWRLDKMFIEVHEYNEQLRKNIGHNVRKDEKKWTSESNSSYLGSSSSSSIYTNRIRQLESCKLENDSLFSNILSLYQHALDGLVTSSVNLEFEDLSLRAEPYIKQSWLSKGPLEPQSLMSLSPSASGMLLLLRDRLHELDKCLESELFENIWQSLAHRLNRLLYNEVILKNRFSEVGSLQLDFDLKRNLLPLLILYTKTPQRFFVDCLEACILLNLKWGTAMLIKELLREALHNSEEELSSSDSSKPQCPLRALNELGIFSLSPEVAEFIIDLRINPNLI